MANLEVTHIGFADELLIKAHNSYAQEFLTEELGLKATGTTVDCMVCSGPHSAALVLSAALAEGFSIGFSEPKGIGHGSGKL